MLTRITQNRRRALGAVAAMLATARLGQTGSAESRPGTPPPGDVPMSDHQSDVTSADLPGQRRSVVHRLPGSTVDLPMEGHLHSFEGATRWLNTDPLTPDGLRGRVVLVDFWTYTCINWIRTLPYVRAWAAKYAVAGLTVVGVHTPEFGFEHDVDNVIAQARAFGVEYPIALDNDYGVWDAFANHYWPAIYIADIDGQIRFHHFGEGEYEATEMVIQQLLVDAGAENVDQNLVMVEPQGLEVAADWPNVKSPETYLGYRQSSGFAQDNDGFDEPTVYLAPEELSLNSWGLTGNWTVAEHAAVLNEPGGRVAFQFEARDLNLVMGPVSKGTSIPFKVFLDGQPAAGSYGTDVRSGDGDGNVAEQRTYQLIRQPEPITSRRFEVEFGDAGVEVYCFTFG
jgi:thiol-disulfide isomerase/thioredoxin